MKRNLRIGISLFFILITLTLLIANVAAQFESNSQHYRFQMKFLGTEGTVRPNENLRISDVRFILNKDTITLKINIYIPRNSGIDKMEISLINDPDRSNRFFLEPIAAKGTVSSIHPLYMDATESYYLKDGDASKKVSFLTLAYKRVGEYYYHLPLNATVDSFYGEFWIVFDKGTNDPSILLENNNISISFSYPYGDARINGIKVPDEYTITTVTPETTDRVKSFVVYYSVQPTSVFIEAVKGHAEPTVLEKMTIWGNSNLGILLIVFTLLSGIDIILEYLANWRHLIRINKQRKIKENSMMKVHEERVPRQMGGLPRSKITPVNVEKKWSINKDESVSKYYSYGRAEETNDLINNIKKLEKAMEDYENKIKPKKK